jgi:hypothetical protein
MNMFEKYKIYKNITKQKPQCVTVYNSKCFHCTMNYDTNSYKVDIFSVKKSDFLYIKPPYYWKTIYFAHVREKNKNNLIYLDGLIAKKLFEYGKQNQK